jgi:hypothetical protein
MWSSELNAPTHPRNIPPILEIKILQNQNTDPVLYPISRGSGQLELHGEIFIQAHVPDRWPCVRCGNKWSQVTGRSYRTSADTRSSASSGVVSTTPAHHEKRRSTPRPFPSSSRYCYEYGGRAWRPSGAVHRVSPAGTDHGTGLRTPSACQHNAPPTARKNPRLFTSPRPGFRSTGKQYALTGSHGPQRSHLTKTGGSPDAS